MAAPTYQSVAAIGGSAGTHTVTMATHAADDIILLFLMSANQAISLSSAEGFALIPGLSNGNGTAGASTASMLDVYWVRATSSSMVAPAVADSGANTSSLTMVIRGCITTGDPWDVVAGDATSSQTNSVVIPGATTTVADCLVVLACSDHFDGAASRGLTLTNGDLTSITNRFDGGDTAGAGNGLVVATAGRAAAGAVGTSTGTNTLGTSGHQGRAFIALKPPTAGGFITAWAAGSNQGDHA